MKKHNLFVALIAALSLPAFAAPGSCERVKDEIQQKIITNGVPEAGFSLEIVPADQPDRPAAQVVGHCANDTFKILYSRTEQASQTE